jgi:hypothetical protein
MPACRQAGNPQTTFDAEKISLHGDFIVIVLEVYTQCKIIHGGKWITTEINANCLVGCA